MVWSLSLFSVVVHRAGEQYRVVNNMICGDKQSAHDCTSFSDEGHVPQLQDNSFTPDVSEYMEKVIQS